MLRMRAVTLALGATLTFAAFAVPAHSGPLDRGAPDLKSAGSLAFGPNGLLFVGDTAGAAVFAIETSDVGPRPEKETLKVENLNQKIAGLLGTDPREIMVNDMAVNPASGKAYLAVSRGRGPDASPVILRVDANGKLAELDLSDVPFAKAELPNAPDPNAQERGRSQRTQSITDLAFVDGKLYVAGLSNEEFSSRLIAMPYPFEKTNSPDGTSVEIYHGSHGRLETRSPVRTFVPYSIAGKPYLLAAYTCTPLVKLPVDELKPGSHVKGTTIAELGNRNNPLDMIVYQKDGKDYILLSNSSRGVMKIPTEGADTAPSISKPVPDKEGLGYQTIDSLKGVVQLDELDKEHAVVLVQADDGNLNLETLDLP